MRNFSLEGISGALVGLLIVMTPAYGASETIEPGTVAPMKTLSDFQKEYSGTKSVVAVLKYYDYLKHAPKTTLNTENIR